MPCYAITLTSRDGFVDCHLDSIKEWFKRKVDSCLVVTELHKSGKVHVHASAEFSSKRASQVTAMLEVLYRKMDVPFTRGVTVKVRTVTERTGWFSYLCKDLIGPPLYVCGWKMSWIHEQVKAAVRCYQPKVDQYRVLHMRTAAEVVIRYAEANTIKIVSKTSFVETVSEMTAEGYMFHNCKCRHLYVTVLARTGRLGPVRSLWECELLSLD